MKRISVSLIVCVLIAAAPAQAISRYTSTSMSCAKVRAAIERDGAAIMSYRGRNSDAPVLYDRYVATQQFCQQEEVTEPKYIPASDTKSCPVRRCIMYDIKNESGDR